MHRRLIVRFRPGLEPMEQKQLMSVGGAAAPFAAQGPRARAAAMHQAAWAARAGADAPQPPLDDRPQAAAADPAAPPQDQPAPRSLRYQVSRITNPTPINHILIPPFKQVSVQTNQPIPGQTYNVLAITMRNSTRVTFQASDGVFVRFAGQSPEHAYPVLTGDEKWEPNQVMVFYILSKQYYPPRAIVSNGFIFDIAGSRGIAIPGPSSIFLRIKYDPAKFPRLLDWIVTKGPGAYGHRTGITDTSLWEFTRLPGQGSQRVG